MRSGRAAVEPAFRGDIDGLRAVAIVLVVAFHVGIVGFSGGFTGVDVFFVISGWLITRNLLLLIERDGQVRLMRFWARRVRRLVPALALMIVATFVATIFFLWPLEWRPVALQGTTAALYVSNLFFARSTDYFSDSLNSSPFLHTWSLGVEEQFYIFWPLLFVVALMVTRHRARLLRRTLIVFFAITLVVSLALCVVLTQTRPLWAFYGLPTRAWEFAAAGLLAAIPWRGLGKGTILRWAAVLGGMSLLAAATMLLSSKDAYPGLWGLLPVGGTLLIIIAGDPGYRIKPVRWLATAPMQWLGRVSYSWYLWHWPFIVLTVAALNVDSVPVRLFAALAALPVAALAYTCFENPVRFSTVLTRSNLRTFGTGVAFTAVALMAAIGLSRYANLELQRSPYQEMADVKRDFTAFREAPCAAGDQRVSQRGLSYCEVGDPNGSRTVLLVGDSHARQWQEAFSRAGSAEGVRVLVRWKSACAAVPNSSSDASCLRYQHENTELVDEIRPEAVILSESDLHIEIVGADIDDRALAAWRQSLADMVESLNSHGAVVTMIADNPQIEGDPLTCLARGHGEEACTPSRDEAMRLRDRRASVEAELGLDTFGTSEAICDRQSCSIRDGSLYIYVDGNHLTEQFTLTQVNSIRAFLSELLAAG